MTRAAAGRTLLALAIGWAATASPASAQSGTVHFERTVAFEHEAMERLPESVREEMPTESWGEFVLHFTPEGSVMLPDPDAEGAEEDDPTTRRRAALALRMMRSSPERSDQEELVGARVSLDRGEIRHRYSFMTRTFAVTEPARDWGWRLSGEESEYLGYRMQKAMAVDVEGDSVIEAWFTLDVPVPVGPGPYGGLPGLILMVSVDAGRTIYRATRVELDPSVRLPEVEEGEAEELDREAYEALVAEKLEELRMRSRRGPGDGGRR